MEVRFIKLRKERTLESPYYINMYNNKMKETTKETISTGFSKIAGRASKTLANVCF